MNVLLFLALTLAADWVSEGGGPHRTNSQPREKTLTPGSVQDLKLLWSRKLEDHALTSPVILGPIVTHRGIKELVFAAGDSGNVYAIDADLGKIFWKRHIDAADACGKFMPATPVISPGPNDPDDGEGHTPMRPIYYVAADGMLHKISPSTGEDLSPPGKFLSTEANATSLNLWKGVVYAASANRCGNAPEGVWAMDSTPDSTPNFLGKGSNVAVDADGTVHPGAPVASTLLTANGMTFTLEGSSLRILDAAAGKPLYAGSPSSTPGSQLALANGHVCFTSAGTLFCYGLPLEIY